MKKTKRRHVIVANFIKAFRVFVYEVKNAIVRCADKLQLNVNNTKDYGMLIWPQQIMLKEERQISRRKHLALSLSVISS